MKREVNMCKYSEKNNQDESKGKEERIVSDPNGSWTGVCIDNPDDKPVQDVDDL